MGSNERKVFCLIPPRRKAIKLSGSSTDSSDINILRSAFLKACESDSILKSLTSNKMIVFQVRDETGEWCDMEKDDKLDNLVEVNVVLIEKVESPTEIPSSTKAIAQLKPGEVLPLDVNVIYSESSQSVETDSNQEKSCLHVTKKVKIESPFPLRTLKQPAKLSVLPALTATLKNKLVEGKVPTDSKDFLKFWGEYLYQETDGNPTKNDYGILATSIVNTFPELAGGTMNNGIVRSQLSTWVRNHRSRVKPKSQTETSAQSENVENKHVFKVNSSRKESALIAVKSTLTASDIESALKELEKPFKSGKNVAHFERLLEDTKDSRRAWIEKQKGNVMDIIGKYPLLANDHMITYECVRVIFEKDVDDVLVIIDNVFDELYQYYATEPGTRCSSTLSSIINTRTDKVDSLIVEQVYKDLLSKPLKNKKINSIWTSCEVLTSTQNWDGAELSAPRALVYFSPEDVLTQAFILADKDVKIEIVDPTVPSVLLTLLSTYYVWHLNFPLAYYSVLDFFFYKIFNVDFKKPNGGAAKFERQLFNATKKK